MRLTSSDGASVELRPTGYEFPDAAAERGDWDANWLVVHGEVRTAEGATWTFDHPCLTTWEALRIRDWLRAAAEGMVRPVDAPKEGSEGLLEFTEPNLGFSVAAVDDHELLLRVHLSLESLAGRPGAEDQSWSELYAYSVTVKMRRLEVLDAAQAWEDDLTPFPER